MAASFCDRFVGYLICMGFLIRQSNDWRKEKSLNFKFSEKNFTVYLQQIVEPSLRIIGDALKQFFVKQIQHHTMTCKFKKTENNKYFRYNNPVQISTSNHLNKALQYIIYSVLLSFKIFCAFEEKNHYILGHLKKLKRFKCNIKMHSSNVKNNQNSETLTFTSMCYLRKACCKSLKTFESGE